MCHLCIEYTLKSQDANKIRIHTQCSCKSSSSQLTSSFLQDKGYKTLIQSASKSQAGSPDTQNSSWRWILSLLFLQNTESTIRLLDWTKFLDHNRSNDLLQMAQKSLPNSSGTTFRSPQSVPSHSTHMKWHSRC